MVRPVSREIPQRRWQTVLLSTKNFLFRIISFLQRIVSFFKTLWSYFVVTVQFIREHATHRNWRMTKYLLTKFMHNSDRLLLFWAYTVAEFGCLFVLGAECLRILCEFLANVKVTSSGFLWVEEKLCDVINACSDVLEEYIQWLEQASNLEHVTFWNDHKNRVIRRTKRHIWNTLQMILHILHPATILTTALRFLGILAVWRWTSLDRFYHGRPPSKFDPRKSARDGYVRVRLGLPTYKRTESDDPWSLSRAYVLMEDYPLENDGSLDLRLVKARWNLNSVLVLDPGRYEHFKPANENYLSRFAIGVLSMRNGYITVVDNPNWFTKKRIEFRQYLLSSRIYYLIRASFLPSILFFMVYATYRSYIAFDDSVEGLRRGQGIVLALILVLTLLYYRGYKWTKMPQRHTKAFIDPQGRLWNAWMGA